MEQHEPNLPLDFVDLLAAFGNAEVRYLIIGGYAVGCHDRPRTTKDLDILPRWKEKADDSHAECPVLAVDLRCAWPTRMRECGGFGRHR